MTEAQLTAARLKGRGKIDRVICETLGIAPRTLGYWKRLPGFQEEVDRVYSNSFRPTPEGALIDALTAVKGDGIDWQARIQAARELNRMEAAAPVEHAPGKSSSTVHFHVTKDAEGNVEFDVEPPDEQPAPEQHDHRLGWHDEAPA